MTRASRELISVFCIDGVGNHDYGAGRERGFFQGTEFILTV
jgi:hypothetical protein